jgi:hypothetical protein
VDLLSLPPEGLLNVLTTLWVEWYSTDEDLFKHRMRIGRQLDELARKHDGQEQIDDMMANPFAGVMRGGPAGVVGA